MSAKRLALFGVGLAAVLSAGASWKLDETLLVEDYEKQVERKGKPEMFSGIVAPGLLVKTQMAAYRTDGRVLIENVSPGFAVPADPVRAFAKSFRVYSFGRGKRVSSKLSVAFLVAPKKSFGVVLEHDAKSENLVCICAGTKRLEIPYASLPAEFTVSATVRGDAELTVAGLGDSSLRSLKFPVGMLKDCKDKIAVRTEFSSCEPKKVAEIVLDELRTGYASQNERVQFPAIVNPPAQFDPDKAGWKKVLDDDFNGTELNPELWTVRKDSPTELVKVENGELRIGCDFPKDCTNRVSANLRSSSVKTKEKYLFGFFEARVKFTRQNGWWAAFWMYGDTNANPFTEGFEIDIFEDYYLRRRNEDGSASKTIDHNLHMYCGSMKSLKSWNYNSELPGSLDDWYDIACRWTPFDISYYLNGKLIASRAWHSTRDSVTFDALSHGCGTAPLHAILSGQIMKKEWNRSMQNLEGCKFPDWYCIDRVRIWACPDVGKNAPKVEFDKRPASVDGEVKKGEKLTFKVSVEPAASKSPIKAVYLFDSGYPLQCLTKPPYEFTVPFDEKYYRTTRYMEPGRQNVVPAFDVPHAFVAFAQDADGKVGFTAPVVIKLAEDPAKYTASKPYRGKPHPVPGTISPDEFDEGGAGVAYVDMDKGNRAAKRPADSVRADEDVDCARGSVGFVARGEWINYTIKVEKHAMYDFVFRYGTPSSAKHSLKLRLDGKELADIALKAHARDDYFPDTEAKVRVELPAGVHILTLCLNGSYNFTNFRFEKSEAELPFAFRERYEQIHQRDMRDFSLVPQRDEFAFRDGCVVPSEDFADYLNVSMGVKAVYREKATPADAVKIEFDGKMPARQYEITVGKSGVLIKAHDRRAALQAMFHLEDVMNLRRAPFLKFGTKTRRGKFARRMTHAGWAHDTFPDGHLAGIAHAGFDTILFYVRGVDRTGAGQCDINDLIDRAEKWGLDAYLYSSLKAMKHPDDPESDADMARSYGAVARKHRKAKGFVIVPESCYFESRDPRVASKTRKVDEKGKPLPNPSRYPCSDYPKWLAKVESTIRAEIPDADVVFWTYNFYWTPEKERFAFIDAVTPSTTLNVTFALGDWREHPTRLSSNFPINDYSICAPGPSALFRAEGARAKARGLKLFTTSNTGGRTWDFGGCSYEPMPQQWKRRFDALCKAQAVYGLSGMIESHHYGFVPNFIAELAKESFTEGGMPFDEHLRLIAARDFGAKNAAETVTIWKDLSDAIKDYVATSRNQYGPFRVGPAYPYNFLGSFLKYGDPAGWPGFRSWICNPNYGWNIPWGGGKQTQYNLDETQHRVEAELFNSAAGRFIAAAQKLRGFAATLGGERAVRAKRQAGIVEYIGRSFVTAANIKAGAIAERIYNSEKANAQEKAAAKEEILRLAKVEYDNTAATLPLVEDDSHLGWECVNGYMGGRQRIVWKLRHMEKLYGIKDGE